MVDQEKKPRKRAKEPPLRFLKGPNNILVPADEETAARVAKWKSDDLIRGHFAAMRNAKFFRKWWVLAKYAYDLWTDHLPSQRTWRGQVVQPEFERFRRDLIIMAGFYTPIFAIDGTLRMEADSISWDNMDEPEFEKLYSATIDAILQKVLNRPDLTAEQLRKYVDTVMRFD